MAITTAEAFLVVLEKSELLTTEQFAEAQDATLLTSDAAELAGMLIRQDLITTWQSTQLLAGRSSFFLGNYALLDLLGRGGMGSVFLARHRTMNRRVALKVVSKQVGKDPASLERFLAEARLIASLDHPNIVQAYDVDKESDRFYIVMEYIEGKDLEVIVQEHGLFGFEEVADCIRQAADGLAHAHDRNMIHCDVKPSNLLLSDQGTIKILDMGMARLAESGEDSGEQVDHKILGTIDYMAPEQAMEGPDFDHRADIYSLGCTFYFLLSGRPPFDEGTLTQRIMKHQTQPPPDIFASQPDTPQELVDICMKMMAKDPADRYQSADEVALLLTGWREPIPAAHAGAGQPQSEGQPQDAHSPQTPGGDSATAQSATNLIMEELRVPDTPAAGPVLKSKKKRTWGEEQQTVMLVAVAVFFAIVVLSVALVVMSLGPSRTDVQEISQGKTMPVSPSVDTNGAPTSRQPSPDPDAGEAQPSPPLQQNDPKTSDPKATEAKPPKPIIPEPPKPELPKPELPKPEPPKPEPPKPEPNEPEPPKPEPNEPEPVDPFHELPTAIDLKLLADTARRSQYEPRPVFKLAMLHIGADSTLKIELVGGGSALPHGDRFLLKPDKDANGEPAWIISLEHRQADKDLPANVARIWFGQGALMFEWLPGVVAETANHLKNCALDITIDGKTRTLALSRPRVVEPLTADLIGGTASRTLTGEYLPNVSNLRLVITALECPVLGDSLKQNTVIEAKGQADIEVNIDKLNRMVARVSYDVKGGRTFVQLECFYQPSGGTRLVRLRASEWKKLEKLYTDSMSRKQRLTADVAKQEGRRPNSSLARKKQQLEVIDKRLAEMAALLSFKEAVLGKGKIFFREYIEVGGRRIEMATTDAPPEKKEGSK